MFMLRILSGALCALALGAARGQAVEAPAAPVALGTLVPGLSTLTMPLRSMRELRYRYMVRQERDFTCGAAALSTILQYVFGRSTSEHEIIEDMLRNTDARTVRENGFSLLDIKKYVERAGLRGRGYQIDSNSLLTLKIPVIALQNTRGFPHFVVVKQVRDGIVYLADPALGHRQMALDEFSAAWNGIVFAVVGADVLPDNALQSDTAQSSGWAQRAGIVTRLLPPQQEFGLLGLDSF